MCGIQAELGYERQRRHFRAFGWRFVRPLKPFGLLPTHS